MLDAQEGSSSKVVDCILCLKGYYQWKLSGAVGVWRYGGTVKITSLPRGYPSSTNSSENDDEYLDEYLDDFVHLSSEVSFEESRAVNTLAFLFDRFGLKLLQAYLREAIRTEELPLNSMVGKILSYVFYCCSHFIFSYSQIVSNVI